MNTGSYSVVFVVYFFYPRWCREGRHLTAYLFDSQIYRCGNNTFDLIEINK